MNRALWAVAILALALGIFFQEADGKADRLPPVLQPYALRVEAFCDSVRSVIGARLMPLVRKLGFTRNRSVEAALRSQGAVGGAPVPVRPNPAIDISYRNGKDLLGQLKCVPAGQRINLRRVSPNRIARDAQPSCRPCAASCSETREQRDLRLAIEAELDRIAEVRR